jgi:hypothetical protein
MVSCPIEDLYLEELSIEKYREHSIIYRGKYSAFPLFS